MHHTYQDIINIQPLHLILILPQLEKLRLGIRSYLDPLVDPVVDPIKNLLKSDTKIETQHVS